MEKVLFWLWFLSPDKRSDKQKVEDSKLAEGLFLLITSFKFIFNCLLVVGITYFIFNIHSFVSFQNSIINSMVEKIGIK